MHVLVGTNDDDYDLLQSSAGTATKRVADWVVPKVAEVGDDVILFFHRAGFVASGKIATEPESSNFRKQAAYRSDVDQLILFEHAVPLEHIRDEVPEWRWLNQQSKSRTTPKPEIAARLWKAIYQFVPD